MSWATAHIEKLSKGETVSFRPRGGSMRGKIDNGQLVTVEPLEEDPSVGDIVLCKVKGNEYLHLVKAIKGKNDKRRFQIGNNRGGINGWIGQRQIHGICTKVMNSTCNKCGTEITMAEQPQGSPIPYCGYCKE